LVTPRAGAKHELLVQQIGLMAKTFPMTREVGLLNILVRLKKHNKV
jgi:hypothetical protein